MFGHLNPGSGSVFSLKYWIRIKIEYGAGTLHFAEVCAFCRNKKFLNSCKINENKPYVSNYRGEMSL
jgi:hypothetical protein